MKVSQFFKSLDAVSDDCNIIFKSPDCKLLPLHFHVTEAATVQKNFIDCGGTERSETYATIQLWTADDYNHRITTGKLRKIILNHLVQSDSDFDLLVENDGESLTTYTIESSELIGNTIVYLLGKKTAQCLAPDKCGVEETSKNTCCKGKCC